MIFWHGLPANKVRWDESKLHMAALHLRKSARAMSIQPHQVRTIDQAAACECESGYATNIKLLDRHVPLAGE
jgi:hypothetical protein